MSDHRTVEEIQALVDGPAEEIIVHLGPAYSLQQNAKWVEPVLKAALAEQLVRRAEEKMTGFVRAIDRASDSSARIGGKMVALTVVIAGAAVVGVADIVVRLLTA